MCGDSGENILGRVNSKAMEAGEGGPKGTEVGGEVRKLAVAGPDPLRALEVILSSVAFTE